MMTMIDIMMTMMMMIVAICESVLVMKMAVEKLQL